MLNIKGGLSLDIRSLLQAAACCSESSARLGGSHSVEVSLFPFVFAGKLSCDSLVFINMAIDHLSDIEPTIILFELIF